MHIIRFGLRIKTGAERTTIVDIFDINQQVRDTDIHLKVLILILVLIHQEPKSSREPLKTNERQVGEELCCVYVMLCAARCTLMDFLGKKNKKTTADPSLPSAFPFHLRLVSFRDIFRGFSPVRVLYYNTITTVL